MQRTFPTDSLARVELFQRFLDAGHEAYAEQAGYSSFQKSLTHFDSAHALAVLMQDTFTIARAVFARGRIYDAWNKEPQKTIDYFTEAAGLFRVAQNDFPRYLYVRHLVAHAYEKALDTANATRVLRSIYAEVAPLPQAARDEIYALPECALIAVKVGAYALADSILGQLIQRSRIVNDPRSYNYLDHYYLTQSELDVFWRKPNLGQAKPSHSAYLDSLTQVYVASTTLMDRAYYSDQLARLYAATNDSARAYRLLTEAIMLRDSLDSQSDVAAMQEALVRSEVNAELSQLAYEGRLRDARVRTVWGLSILLGLITVISLYLFRRNRQYSAQSTRLTATNAALDERVADVELLNKEIQHRVKNNLYMVYSLLHMQERRSDNEDTIEQLQTARLRVESIAELHNQLMGGKGALDYGAYLRSLINAAVSCLANNHTVKAHLTTEPVDLPLNHYFALSLILNEWVTNSIKYADPATDRLEITVDIRNRDGTVYVMYRDNSVHAGTVAATSGLGTQIVQLLTRQLSATLTSADQAPYHYCLSIPIHGGQDSDSDRRGRSVDRREPQAHVAGSGL